MNERRRGVLGVGLSVGVTVAFVSSLALSACGSSTVRDSIGNSCIAPALTSIEDQREIASKIAAKLDKALTDGSLEVSFKDAAKASFKELSDPNATLLLFLRAIDCYTQPPTTAAREEVAKRLGDALYVMWTAKATGGQGSTDVKITHTERAALERTTAGRESLKVLLDHGYMLDQ